MLIYEDIKVRFILNSKSKINNQLGTTGIGQKLNNKDIFLLFFFYLFYIAVVPNVKDYDIVLLEL